MRNSSGTELQAARLIALASLGAALITAGGNRLADDEPPTTSVQVFVAPSAETPTSPSFSSGEPHNRPVAPIEIDGELYVRALEVFEGIEAGPGGRAGAGEDLEKFLDDQGVSDRDEHLFVDSPLRALLGHAEGRYREGEGAVAPERVPELLRLLWSFHRAWVDRYGSVQAAPQRP